ncbi:stalk domain-containing protein [Cohnella sp. GCM10020058]|uniref:stalk domain-containing protein n=1 Tax=Cohnella sp. GCM10020058 TaxID=3317330 RepID=UPI00363830DC
MKNNMMKKSVLGAMVLGMTITGAAGVYAGTNLQKITAYLNSSIGIKVNGSAYVPTDANGNKLTPITYHDTTYLPVRALAGALGVQLTFDPKTNQVVITTNGSQQTADLASIGYTSAQIKEIQTAFAAFDGFTTPYMPTLMAANDTYKQASATGDGVNFVFSHMIVNVSPRDYAFDYEGTNVTLSNGVQAKWYKPSDTDMLTFKLDDRYVTLSSMDGALNKAQLEKIAVGVAKQSDSTAGLAIVSYSDAQFKAIKDAFAGFDGFTTAYAPTLMAGNDAFKQAAASDDGVNFLFSHMRVSVSPRDYSDGYDSTKVTLSNGVQAKWYKPSDTDMLTFKLDDRFVTISSPDGALNKAKLEQIAVGVAKLK